MDEQHLTKADVLRLSDITRPTLNAYLAGGPIGSNKMAWALCGALGWTDDSIDRILQGGRPERRALANPVTAVLGDFELDELMVLLDEIQVQQRSVIDEIGRRARNN